MYKSPELKEAINTNAKIRVGAVLDEGPSAIGSSTNKVTYRPGPCMISFFPTFGAMASSSASDAPTNTLDDAIQHLYDKVFLGIRNRRLYTPAQFGLALKQFSSYVILHAWLRRVYAIVSNKYPNNGYYPKGYLQLEALDPSWQLEQDKLKEFINTVGNRINSLNIPDLPVYRHQYDMVLKIWTDDKELEGQQIIFSPSVLQKFFENEDKEMEDILVRELMPAGLYDWNQSTAGMTINDVIQAYNNMDDMFNNVQWLSSYVSADLANAMARTNQPFKKFTVPMVTDKEPLTLCKDKKELEKISNATLIGNPTPLLGWMTGIVAGDLYEKHYTSEIYENSIRYNTFGARVISTYDGTLNDDTAVWATMSLDEEIILTNHYWTFDYCGTEILFSARYIETVGGRSSSNPASWKIYYGLHLNIEIQASMFMSGAWNEVITNSRALEYLPEWRLFVFNNTTFQWATEPRDLKSCGIIAINQYKYYAMALNQTAYDSTFAEVKGFPNPAKSSRDRKFSNSTKKDPKDKKIEGDK